MMDQTKRKSGSSPLDGVFTFTKVEDQLNLRLLLLKKPDTLMLYKSDKQNDHGKPQR